MRMDRSGFDDDVLRELASNARTRAREAAGRAESARKRNQELATGRPSTVDHVEGAAEHASRQSDRARDALRHSAESHDRAARVHDEAATLGFGFPSDWACPGAGKMRTN